jgi:uncharacterized membrane protein
MVHQCGVLRVPRSVVMAQQAPGTWDAHMQSAVALHVQCTVVHRQPTYPYLQLSAARLAVLLQLACCVAPCEPPVVS